MLDFEAEGDVVKGGHVFEQGVVLEDEADVALLDGDAVDLEAADEDAAAGGSFQAGDEAQDGGFAAAAGAEQGEQLALGDREVDVLNRSHLAVTLGDVL